MGIKSNKLLHQSHGMTGAEIEELKYKQANGMEPDMITANRDPEFKIKAHEKHLVHVYLENEVWVKGKKTSKGRIQCFYQRDFDIMSKTVAEKGAKHRPQNAFGQYDVVKVIHYPSTGAIANQIVDSVNKEEIELEDMNKEQLTQKLYELTGEDVNQELNEVELIQAIRATQSA